MAGRFDHHAIPRARAAASMKPRAAANISGSSSRKASWPLSLSTSTKPTDAAGRIERVHDGAGIGGRKQPVGGERDHAEPRREFLEAPRQTPPCSAARSK